MPDASTVSEIAAIQDLPPVERAAAIMHMIYIQTIRRPDVDWQTDLSQSWAMLDERAKAFNRAILETWTWHPDLLRLWTETVRLLEVSGEGGKSLAASRVALTRAGAGREI